MNRICISTLVAAMAILTCGTSMSSSSKWCDIEFKPTSASLEQYKVPQWYKDAKFGIYFHWSAFSVPAYKT
ncbi:MAG: alpha-L-fucosidase, partial [Candidatus Hydrogenedentes bacterium]|nr:alpha-L-fucosidase [Candidatus Hydrogenedentota bacterium]